MSHSNYTGRMSRALYEINPYMRGPVEPMPERSKDFPAGVALVLAAAALVIMALAGWLPGAGA